MSKVAEEAIALLDSGDKKGAMRVINSGLNKDPDDMAALMVAASIISRESAWGMTYNLLKYVMSKSPGYSELLNNFGMAASSLASSSGKDKYLDEADGALRLAYLKDTGPQVTANLALVNLHKLNLEDAERFALECLRQDPDNAQARETIGYVHLHRGHWYKGFGNYEWTLGGKYRDLPKGKYWEVGERGKRLLVRGEQGIGDEITYASVLPQASQDNIITYECDARLEGLMRRSLKGVTVRGVRFVDDKNKGWQGEYDSVALTGSLCMEYRQKDEDFPRTGFLIPDPIRCTQWKAALDLLPGKKVGIAWSGGLDNTFKHRRSFGLEALLPILQAPGITWVSLQYNDPSADIAELKAKHGIEIVHWKRAVDKGVDYDETAALVSQLDAVVSVTTAVVHLCGALGKKCYVLVPEKCRWFYTSHTSRHRWYDALELFRQKGEWPIERLAGRLREDLCK